MIAYLIVIPVQIVYTMGDVIQQIMPCEQSHMVDAQLLAYHIEYRVIHLSTYWGQDKMVVILQKTCCKADINLAGIQTYVKVAILCMTVTFLKMCSIYLIYW